MTLFRIIRQNFSPLAEPNFRTYIIGQAISLVGTWLQVTAQGWVVWEISQSEAALGVVGMLTTLPLLLLSPWAGVWADRLNRRGLLIATQAAAMILAFILAALTQFKAVQLWHVYVLSFLLGVISAIDFPAQQAFLGDLAGISEVRKAVNLNATILQVSRMIGPAMAGWVIGVLGTATAFWLNGISFIAVIVSLLLVRSSQKTSTQMRGSVASEFFEGLKFVRDQPRLQDLFLFVCAVTLFGLPVLGVMPAFASNVLQGDAQTFGLILASSGAGALVSTLIFAPLAQSRQRIGRVMGIVLVWMGLWFVLLSFARWMSLAMLSVFAFSIGAPMIIATSLGLMQMLTPLEMRARLVSLFTMISFGLQPFAALFIGYSAESVGIVTAVLINGSLLILSSIAIMSLRRPLWSWVPKPHPQTTVSIIREFSEARESGRDVLGEDK